MRFYHIIEDNSFEYMFPVFIKQIENLPLPSSKKTAFLDKVAVTKACCYLERNVSLSSSLMATLHDMRSYSGHVSQCVPIVVVT